MTDLLLRNVPQESSDSFVRAISECSLYGSVEQSALAPILNANYNNERVDLLYPDTVEPLKDDAWKYHLPKMGARGLRRSSGNPSIVHRRATSALRHATKKLKKIYQKSGDRD